MSTTTDATMAEQLREWALELESFTPRDSETCAKFTGILAGMRQVARDKAPTRVFDRVVTFTRHWCDDWEMVIPRLTVGIGPVEAWTDQVRAEVEDAIIDAKLAWEQVSIEGEGGAERLVTRARLRFEYSVSEYPEHTDAEVLQQLLYDEGGVCGDFQLVDGGEG